MAIKVKNINGTSGNVCGCESWMTHWAKHSRTTVSYCAEEKCIKKPEHGAHVQKDNDRNWYIIPLCAGHNGLRSTEFLVTDGTVFVPANKQITCG